MRFRPLASSSSGCAYLVTDGDNAPLLIDAGLTIKELRKATGFGLSHLAGCLVSHAHGDHSKAVECLLDCTVDVFASKDTLGALGVSGHHRSVPLLDQTPVQIGPWRVLPFEVKHDAPGTMGFVVESTGGKLLYLTDTPYTRFTFPGLTHIAVEANWHKAKVNDNVMAGAIDVSRATRTVSNHMSLDQAVKLVKSNDLSKVEEVWLLHLSSENSDAELFKRTMQEATGKPVFVAAEREVVA